MECPYSITKNTGWWKLNHLDLIFQYQPLSNVIRQTVIHIGLDIYMYMCLLHILIIWSTVYPMASHATSRILCKLYLTFKCHPGKILWGNMKYHNMTSYMCFECDIWMFEMWNIGAHITPTDLFEWCTCIMLNIVYINVVIFNISTPVFIFVEYISFVGVTFNRWSVT